MKHYKKLVRLLKKGDKTAEELYKEIYGNERKEKGIKQSISALVYFVNEKDINFPITSYNDGELYYRIIKECSHCYYRNITLQMTFILIGIVFFIFGISIGFLFTEPIIEYNGIIYGN